MGHDLSISSRALCQPLEPRLLLANWAVLYPAGTLYIHGTWGDDQIEVSSGYQTNSTQPALNVTRNREKISFDPSVVKRLIVTTSTGDDRVNLIDAYRQLNQSSTALPVTVVGGAGNDTLTGCDAADVLRGDEGDDILIGRQGIDTCFGGGGNDTVYANSSARLSQIETVKPAAPPPVPYTVQAAPDEVLIADGDVQITWHGSTAWMARGEWLMGLSSKHTLDQFHAHLDALHLGLKVQRKPMPPQTPLAQDWCVVEVPKWVTPERLEAAIKTIPGFKYIEPNLVLSGAS